MSMKNSIDVSCREKNLLHIQNLEMTPKNYIIKGTKY
jgi:hypothetical protein